MLKIHNTALLVIDVQGKLAQLMYDKETMFANQKRIIEGARLLALPIIWAEQLPDKLGPTTPEIAELLQASCEPSSKVTFSCCGNETLQNQIQQVERKQFLVIGIETHVCVYQTTLDLLEQNYEAHVVTDAVSSRTAENKALGIQCMHEAGATLTGTEMALFELLRRADHAQFKKIARLVK
ncbi:hydrolase [Anaerolineales bacterium HSG24]|nr:hydrolase [Anaerolineales bacterium HSG24]